MEVSLETVQVLGIPLLLLIAANGAPVLARLLLKQRYCAPIDGGRCFVDGRPLLGPAKTWRGLFSSLIVTTLLALVAGWGWWLGGLFALLCMLGDMLSSFIKRRLDIAVHGRVVVLDQLPEALLPLWLLRGELGLDLFSIMALTVLFLLLDVVISPLLYRLHLRLRPY